MLGIKIWRGEEMKAKCPPIEAVRPRTRMDQWHWEEFWNGSDNSRRNSFLGMRSKYKCVPSSRRIAEGTRHFREDLQCVERVPHWKVHVEKTERVQSNAIWFETKLSFQGSMLCIKCLGQISNGKPWSITVTENLLFLALLYKATRLKKKKKHQNCPCWV